MTHNLTKGTPTTPVENILQLNENAQKSFMDKYFRLMRDMSNPVAIHKEILGKQTYCINLEFRFWTWEFPETGLRVYVNNAKGVCLEIVGGLTLEETIHALEIYFGRMGA